MSQHDYILSDADGATFLADLNDALEAIATTNKGTSRPATVYPGELWIDDNTPSSTVWTLSVYDGTDDIRVGQIDTVNNKFLPEPDAVQTLANKTLQNALLTGVVLVNAAAQVGGTRLCIDDSSGSGQLRARHSTGLGALLNQSAAAGIAYLLNQDNADLALGANNAALVWLKAAGFVSVGAASPAYTNGKAVVTHTAAAAALVTHNTDATGAAQSSVIFNRNASTVGSINTTATATSYGTASDRRLKADVEPLADPGELIDALRPSTWAWAHHPGEPRGVGFVAQELAAVAPEAVTPGDDDPDRTAGDDGFEQWGVDVSKLVPYLVAELQRLRARVAALEA